MTNLAQALFTVNVFKLLLFSQTISLSLSLPLFFTNSISPSFSLSLSLSLSHTLSLSLSLSHSISLLSQFLSLKRQKLTNKILFSFGSK